MIDQTEPYRRALALVGALAAEDSFAAQALRPGDSPAVRHLWAIDPLAAAGVEPEEQDARRLVDALAVLVLTLAEAANLSRDDLLFWVRAWLAELSEPAPD